MSVMHLTAVIYACSNESPWQRKSVMWPALQSPAARQDASEKPVGRLYLSYTSSAVVPYLALYESSNIRRHLNISTASTAPNRKRQVRRAARQIPFHPHWLTKHKFVIDGPDESPDQVQLTSSASISLRHVDIHKRP